jgi:hypothetical protein
MKIRCKVCSNTDGTVCLLKGNAVAQNKPRRCPSFEFAPEKAKTISKMEAIYVPYNIRTRKEYKKSLKEAAKTEYIQKIKQNVTPDCLANFRANVTD